MKQNATAFLSGLIFAVGLGVAGMTKPANVIAFLDVTGAWDPALAFVMVGGIAVYALAYWGTRVRLAHAAPSGAVDTRLVVGSLLFGVGWGIAGYCPGPALVAAAAGAKEAMLFSVCMLASFWFCRRVVMHLQHRDVRAPENG